MNTQPIIRLASIGFIAFSALSLLSVSLMAFASPQAVMDLVAVRLTNPDAFSSIRGVYGGVGLAICFSLLYLIRHDLRLALGFLSMLWGFYAASRGLTIYLEGPLGSFGTQWMITETILLVFAITLFRLNHRPATT